MTLAKSNEEPKVTADVIAEAAAWLAVLHGPNRTAATERGFSLWMKESASHARAFEEATGIWEEARNLPRPKLLHRSFRQQARPRLRLLKSAAVAAVLALLTVGAMVYIQQEAGVGTNIGEQRVLALDDGTRVILNTDTRVVVSYDREIRRVELKEGEALFEVAREPARPFIVAAGERKIVALGTSFVVRRDARQLAVTLIEGRVVVSSVPASGVSELLERFDKSSSIPNKPETPDAGTVTPVLPSGTVTLRPGERVVFTKTRLVKKDRPPLEKLLAWQRREVALDNAALTDAVAEMNRYNRKPVQIAIAESSDVRVTGLFRAGDSLSFARAVAEAYHLEVIEEPDGIVLSGVPTAQQTSLR